MPILKSAKKRMKQTETRTKRLRPYRTRMLTLVKNIIKWVQSGEVKKAEDSLQETYSAIDTAVKKKILHKNTASRKKSLVMKSVTKAGGKAPAKKVEKAKAPAKKAPTKKTTPAKKPATTKPKATAAKKAAATKKAPAKK
jgi:small subunit ribosomal protein S20